MPMEASWLTEADKPVSLPVLQTLYAGVLCEGHLTFPALQKIPRGKPWQPAPADALPFRGAEKTTIGWGTGLAGPGVWSSS